MKVMAARFLEKGDSRETATILWTELLDSSSDEAIKETARINLELLRADEDVDQINALAQRFTAKMGRPPTSIGEMAQAGLVGGEPVDPTGHPYVIGLDGKARFRVRVRCLRKKVCTGGHCSDAPKKEFQRSITHSRVICGSMRSLPGSRVELKWNAVSVPEAMTRPR